MVNTPLDMTAQQCHVSDSCTTKKTGDALIVIAAQRGGDKRPQEIVVLMYQFLFTGWQESSSSAVGNNGK
jgi:hypothetical protein